MNGTSSSASWEGSARPCGRAKLLSWPATLAAFAAVVALLCLSGCASARGGGDFDPSQYNPNTGYPAIGGGLPWHM